MVTVGDGGLTGVTVRLPVATAVSGWRQISGVVMGSGGEPLEGVSVEGHGASEYADWEVTTDTEGRFEATVLATTYEVGFNHGRCLLGWYAGGSTLVEGRTEAQSISTERGDVTGINVSAGANCRRLHGVVVGPGGEPMEGLQLSGSPRGSGRFWSRDQTRRALRHSRSPGATESG